MSVLRALIVDDEPLGRERIRTLLGSRNDVAVGAEAEDGIEAVGLLESETFDLVFLDIQMPHLGGFEVVREIGADRMPPVVFVTAHDEFALRAFEVHALDYLLKPFEPERFYEALDRVLGLIGTAGRAEIDTRVQKLIDDLEPKERPLERLMIRGHSSIRFVKAEDIDYIEAAGNYVNIRIANHSHLLRQTMKSLEQRLDPYRFLRIHRSTIVNLDRVKELHSTFSGDYEVTLHDGTKLTLSRSYRHVLDRFA